MCQLPAASDLSGPAVENVGAPGSFGRRQIAESRKHTILAFRERIADAGDHAIPLFLFGCGVVDQYTGNEAASEITTVVPDQAVSKTGNHKEIGGYPSIDDVTGWTFLGQKSGRRIIGIVTDGLNREISASVRSKESRPISGFRLPAVVTENTAWQVNVRAGLRHHVPLPTVLLSCCQSRPKRQNDYDHESVRCHHVTHRENVEDQRQAACRIAEVAGNCDWILQS